jgi:lauroyl/myristoyl acyltransferase
MCEALLDLNYRVITPLASHLRPRNAYRVTKLTGGIGKPLDRHRSFVFSSPAAPIGIDALVNYLGVDLPTAESIVKRIYRLETRCEIEHTWLAERRHDLLPQIIDMDSVRAIAAVINDRGPMLLLSAHTLYYVMLLWALHATGNNIAFMMVNPRSATRSYGVLHEGLIKSAHSLSQLMPVLFTNEGNTVNRSIELLKRGYTVMMLLDVPGKRKTGLRVEMFNDIFFVPAGCTRICKGSGVPAASVFSFVPEMDKPYALSFSPPASCPEKIDVQEWARHLESIASRSPHSWIGWFGLRHMQ